MSLWPVEAKSSDMISNCYTLLRSMNSRSMLIFYMAKTPIKILGTEYSSVSKAARALRVSKISLYRVIKSGVPIDPVIPNLKSAFGAKIHAKSIIIKEVEYPSISAAAKNLGISKSSLLNAITKTLSGSELNEAVESLLANKRGFHKTSLKINTISYSSFTEAGKAFGVDGGTISNWCKQQRTTNLTIDVRVFQLSKIEKGSIEHMRALAHESGFHNLKDWYEKGREDADLGTFMVWLKKEWGSDLLAFLEKEFPGEAIEWWRMSRTPRGTWQRHERLKEYMKWLFRRLEFTNVRDWYAIQAKDFNDNFGGSIQAYYPSIIDRLEICYPDSEWLPWRFAVAPNACWENRENHRKFLDYVAVKEEWTQPEEWYKATRATFTKHKGASILKFYDSIFSCIKTNYPDYEWKFWFMKNSRGNWDKKVNQKQYLEWLGDRLCFTKPDDWYGVTEEDFLNNHGSRLLSKTYYGGAAKCVMAVFDEHDWEPIIFRGASQWKTQLRLYAISRCALPNMEVEREYPADALVSENSNSKLRLDVFISDQGDSGRLAIEYHGRQHYELVEHFHKTKKEFLAAQKRDQLKKKILEEAGVRLVEIKYSSWAGEVAYVLDILNRHFELSVTEDDVREQANKNGLYDSIFLESETKTNRMKKASSLPSLKPLAIAKILRLADAWYEKYETWPKKSSGNVLSLENLTWSKIDKQLQRTDWGSFANLLFLKRDVRHHLKQDKLTIHQIIEWAKDHFGKTKEWPTYKSGNVLAEPSENWSAIRSNLVAGGRGLPKGLSVEKVLFDELGVVGVRAGKKLTEQRVLTFALMHYEETGSYPTESSDWILDGKDSWPTISFALNQGLRGLPGGSSLAKLLQAHNLKANPHERDYPSKDEIVDAAEIYQALAIDNKLPTKESGSFLNPKYLDLSWGAINSAITRGAIEDVQAKTLADLWVLEFDYRNVNDLGKLTECQILQWCDIYQSQHPDELLPSNQSESIPEMGTETFMGIDTAIRENRRGLQGLVSLDNLLFKKRGKRSNRNLPLITLKQIESWMVAWHGQNQKWPSSTDGEIPDSGSEKWSNINAVLHRGGRGLPKTSLAKLKAALIKKVSSGDD